MGFDRLNLGSSSKLPFCLCRTASRLACLGDAQRHALRPFPGTLTVLPPAPHPRVIKHVAMLNPSECL